MFHLPERKFSDFCTTEGGNFITRFLWQDAERENSACLIVTSSFTDSYIELAFFYFYKMLAMQGYILVEYHYKELFLF